MIHCPVCNEDAKVFDTLDFNKSCNNALPPSGKQYAYCLCDNCGFCFCPEIAAWPPELFAKHIYNDDYALVDPDYKMIRPRANTQFVAQLFGKHGKRIRHLDYGGGNGLLAATLKSMGWKSTSYDPFVNRGTKLADLGKFDLITAFEVFEHAPDPQELMRSILSALQPGGVILFSTLLSDNNLSRGRALDWWYASPRNGHISLYSRNSLALLAQQHYLQLSSRDANVHIMHDGLTLWGDTVRREFTA